MLWTVAADLLLRLRVGARVTLLSSECAILPLARRNPLVMKCRVHDVIEADIATPTSPRHAYDLGRCRRPRRPCGRSDEAASHDPGSARAA